VTDPDVLDEYGHPERPVWASLDRMLYELCDGPCMRRGCHVYACDYPNGCRAWYCKSCYPADVLQQVGRTLREARASQL
jgi:hypothetical protein